MASTLLIRSATVDDADALANIIIEGWRFAYRGLLPEDFLAGLSVEAWAESMRKNLEANETGDLQDKRVVFSPSKPESILGVCSFGPDRTNDSVGEIYARYVSPALVGTGLGRILMQDAVVRLSEIGFSEAYLWFLKDNERAMHFYEKAGFEMTGETKTEQRGDIRLHELRMRKILT